MNAERRKQLTKIVEQLELLRDDVSQIKDEEQDAFDNMPESLQQGERGQASEQAIDSLDSAYTDIDSAVDSINNAIGD